MDFLTRLIGGVSVVQSRKPNANDPQQRLNRFKKIYSQTLQVWHRVSAGKGDAATIESLRLCLQRLTTVLGDDQRAPAPHLCLAYAVSSQLYTTVTNIALALDNEDITREAAGWFSALVDSDGEGLLEDPRFADALTTFAEHTAGPKGPAVGSQVELDVLELMFAIAAKIRLDPELLPVWFMSEEEASQSSDKINVGDRRRFPLCYQFISRVYNEGRGGDFARTGLLYIFESVTNSPELERWIIESDLPTLMASGLGALYSQLSRKLAISHPRQELPLILALSDDGNARAAEEADNFYSEELQASLTTFLSNLVFWQDILEHCRSLHIKQTLIDHFQIFFLQQILYPSLLESSDIDGGSAVAVLTYMWRMLDSLNHPDLLQLILRYLLALSDEKEPQSAEPRSPAVEKRRQSILEMAYINGRDDGMSPALFNLVDLIRSGVDSASPETVTASLRLTTILLLKHHEQAYTTLLKTRPAHGFRTDRNLGILHSEMNAYFGLLKGLSGGSNLDDAYDDCVKDAITLVESHTCTVSMFGMRRAGYGVETRHRSAILEDNTQLVRNHSLIPEDPLLQSLLTLLATFFTNGIEVNLALTNVLSQLATCPYTNLEGWLVSTTAKPADPTSPNSFSDVADLTAEDDREELDPYTEATNAEASRMAAFKNSCKSSHLSEDTTPVLLVALRRLSSQLERIRADIPDFDHLVASRKRALEGASVLEDTSLDSASALSPRLNASASRDSSRSRLMLPESASKSSGQNDPTRFMRGRAITAIAGQQTASRPTSPGTPTRLGRPPSASRGAGIGVHARRLSASPSKFARTLSPLAAVMSASEEGGPTLNSPIKNADATSPRSMDAELSERKITFHVSIESSRHNVDEEQEDGRGKPSSPDAASYSSQKVSRESTIERESSLNHVLTNVVILQEFVLEMMALIQVRASLLDGEIVFH